MEPLLSETHQTFFGVTARKELHHFVKKARGRHVFKKPCHFGDGALRGRFHLKAQLRGDAHGAHHPHRILAIALRRISDHADTFAGNVFKSVVIVEDFFAHRIVIHGVYRKVATGGIFPHFAEDVVADDAPVLVFPDPFGIKRPERRTLNDFFAVNDVHQTETLADDVGAPLDFLHLLRRRISRNVKVFRRRPDQKVTYGPPDDIGLKPPLLQKFAGLSGTVGHHLGVDAVGFRADHHRNLIARGVGAAQKIGHRALDAVKHDGKSPGKASSRLRGKALFALLPYRSSLFQASPASWPLGPNQAKR